MKDLYITQYVDKEEIIIEAQKALKVVHISISFSSLPWYLQWTRWLFEKLAIVSVLVTTFSPLNLEDDAVIKAEFLAPGDTMKIEHTFKIKVDN
jgi:hypothetical protein